ncbi:tRNA uracil 4-sulfurtransferase ThiI [Oceanobacter mangrovi]|uniref:tRNA uracil 4-sulfurtransferase ThiI n=1 Tax=Oceanobacter mangrovi TaxID=2862510 RepID=UPI001C8DAB60|nr:tRNA uracil 4-sulfurtransferase ThiI [Oceanobacter mangrovi]
MKFVIKLFPEITIKSKSVRKQMTKILRANLRNLCRKHDVSADVQDRWDSLVIAVNVTEDSDPETVHRRMVQILSHTPGIGYSLEIDEHPFETLDQAYQLVREANRDVIKGKTFCVRVKRAGNHDFTSHQAEIYMGGGLLKETEAAGVSLKNPDVVVNVEIRNDKVHVVKHRIQGLGGFPLGSQGEIMSLISGGYDSTVASYLLTRRGLKTHFCFFNLGGSAHEIGVKQVAHYIWSLYGESHRVKFVTVPFEDVVTEILTNVDDGQMGVVLKRMMMRAASRVASRMNVHAIATGEAVAQVASQTISNLAIIDRAADCMVLRPLSTMDKQDIIAISRRIGTEAFAASMPEYCGVISVNPLTQGDLVKTEKAEQAFDMQVLENALANARIQRIDEVLAEAETGLEDVVQLNTPALSDVIIDIRHPGELEGAELQFANNKVLAIPFYELDSRLAELDVSGAQRYLLYCQKGTMSKIHAHHLNQKHAGVFGVYRDGAA